MRRPFCCDNATKNSAIGGQSHPSRSSKLRSEMNTDSLGWALTMLFLVFPRFKVRFLDFLEFATSYISEPEQHAPKHRKRYRRTCGNVAKLSRQGFGQR